MLGINFFLKNNYLYATKHARGAPGSTTFSSVADIDGQEDAVRTRH
jgi:hypothetical protein